MGNIINFLWQNLNADYYLIKKMDIKLLAIINRNKRNRKPVKYIDIHNQEEFDNRKTNKYLRILCNIRLKLYDDITGAETWDMSQCRDMSNMFKYYKRRIPDGIGNWDTSNCVNMNGMFSYYIMPIPDTIGKWNTKNVKSMICMFSYCKGHIPDTIEQWNIDNCYDMEGMFQDYKGKRPRYP